MRRAERVVYTRVKKNTYKFRSETQKGKPECTRTDNITGILKKMKEVIWIQLVQNTGYWPQTRQ
jgi:hypothetical protein